MLHRLHSATFADTEMFNLKNITALKVLMIVSELLLASFVAQWLYSQYGSEKDILRKSLYQQFIKSKDQAMDSMLVQNLIDPILKDKKGFKVHLEINDGDSATGNGLFKEDRIEKIMLSHDGKNTIAERDSLPPQFDMMKLRHRSDSTKDLLVHGVKLIFKEMTSGDGDSIDKTFYYKTDTVLLKKLFDENLARNGLKLQMQWVSGNDTVSGKNNSAIYFESSLDPGAPGAAFSHYNLYLFEKLTPQFLFALVLLLFTTAAFFISYKSVKKQMELSALKNDFISNISHELKTPVTTVKVAIEALQDFDLKNNTQKAEEYINIAALEMNRLDLLVSNVLTTSMLEDGVLLLNIEIMDLVKVADETINSFRLRLSSQKVNVRFEKPQEIFLVNLDKLHVQGVLLNLLDNSLKYAGPDPEILVAIQNSADKITLSVSDNGPGIPQEYINKIFEKFFRVPTGNRHNIKGYGLGLSYASLIMDKHHGSITVKNNVGTGSTFTLIFPKA